MRLSRLTTVALTAVASLALVVGSGAVTSPASAQAGDLDDPSTKEIAMQLVSSAENASLRWRAQYKYIEDIDDGRGYTAGTVGFCSGTGDMLQLVRRYTEASPENPLARFLPALERVNGTDSHRGLGRPFVRAWKRAAADPAFQAAQDAVRDRLYFDPAVALAKTDGLGALGQFAYYDAAVVHGYSGLKQIRRRALEDSDTPTGGEAETFWLRVFLRERLVEMRKEAVHREQLDRITKTQKRFLDEGNLALQPPLRWRVNQTSFEILEAPTG